MPLIWTGQVQLVGHVEDVRQRFHAISVERKIRHPAVLAISDAVERPVLTDADPLIDFTHQMAR